MYASRIGLRPLAAAGGSQYSQGTLKELFTHSHVSEQMSQDEDEGSSEAEEEYGHIHKLVLQGVLSAGFLDAKGVKKLFQESCSFLKCKVPVEEHISPPYIQKVVREINEKIKSFDMMIRSATCEITGEKFYVYLITIEKIIMRLQQYFRKVELDFFYKIINSVLRKQRCFTISMTESINIAAELDSRVFNKRDAEDFIEKMVVLKYFTKVFKEKGANDFEITLGFRTIREFEPIFRDIYTDCFKTCCLCKMIMLNGLQCPKCAAVIHRACVRRFIKNSTMCVSCKAQWKNEHALLIRTKDGTGDHYQKSFPNDTSRSAVVSGPSKRSRILSLDDEVEMPVLEPMVMVSSRSAGKVPAIQKPQQKSPLSKQGIKESEAVQRIPWNAINPLQLSDDHNASHRPSLNRLQLHGDNFYRIDEFSLAYSNYMESILCVT